MRSQVVNVRENWFSSYDEYVQKTERELKKKDAEIERKHDYYVYQCNDCGKEFVSQQSPNLWAECQYGSTIKAIAVSAMNTMNAAMNKVPLFLSGMTNGRVEPCEGTRS